MTKALVEPAGPPAVFAHEKRREWGLGIIAWETNGKRGYLFENGQLRVFAEDFYRFMHEVDCPLDEIQALYACLKRELDSARADAGYEVPARSIGSAATMSFDDQLAIFRADYSGGFDDAEWIQTQRGTDAKKRLTTHRDSAIEAAKTKLGAPALEQRIAKQQFRTISDDVLELLRSTDLVPASEFACLKTEDAEQRRVLAVAISDLLHGEAGFGSRFDRFLSAIERGFGQPASWQLATALPALVHPVEHVCVRPTSFREQAKWMAPRLALPKLPTAASYVRALGMSKLVFGRLSDVGLLPRDMLDVHDFIRMTTTPAAKKRLVAMKRARPARPPAQTAESTG